MNIFVRVKLGYTPNFKVISEQGREDEKRRKKKVCDYNGPLG